MYFAKTPPPMTASASDPTDASNRPSMRARRRMFSRPNVSATRAAIGSGVFVRGRRDVAISRQFTRTRGLRHAGLLATTLVTRASRGGVPPPRTDASLAVDYDSIISDAALPEKFPRCPRATDRYRGCGRAIRAYGRGGRTIVSIRCSINASGSSQRPLCAGEVWITALRGATSQWKRSRGERRPIAPASGPPLQMTGIAARCLRIASRSSVASRAATRCGSNSMRASRKSREGHETMTPTLTNSSRSTRGHDADHRVVVASDMGTGADTERFLDERARRGQPPLQVVHVAVSAGIGGCERAISRKPCIGHEGQHLPQRVLIELAGHRCVNVRERFGAWQQHMVANAGKRIAAACGVVAAGMMEVQGRPVIDHPQLPMPDQQVRVPRRTVDVHDERVEPHDLRCKRAVGRVGDRVERRRAGQVVERQIDAGALADQVLDFRVRLGAGEIGVELDQRELGHRKPCRARELAGDKLGHERIGALAGTAELEHVEARRRRLPRSRATTRPRAAA